MLLGKIIPIVFGSALDVVAFRSLDASDTVCNITTFLLSSVVLTMAPLQLLKVSII